jgi:LAS superfamily LD-carboxypeptidase LdcB
MEVPMNYEILINKENPIDQKYLKEVVEPSLVEIEYTRDNDDIFESYQTTDKRIFLEKETAKAWYELKKHLVNKGLEFDICSGFLSLELQENKYNSFLKRNGLELTQRRMCKPGYSEHHTGLAIDCDYFINGDWAGICNDDNPETKYIHSILHNFGFILRYPKHKQEITGMQYEPWHIRYVGKELAKKLYEEDLTLEEFFLKKVR